MPPQKTIEYRVKEIFADVLGLSGPIVGDALIYHLGMDSLDLMEICTEIESEFEVEVEDDAADKWRTIWDVIRYVRNKIPLIFTQEDVDKIVARAKALGATDGLTHKQGHLQLSSYGEPYGPETLAMLIVNGWDGKYDLIYATQALIEFLSERGIES
jgi:acyl carrier protein